MKAVLAGILVCAASGLAATVPRVAYSKSFPQSNPAYVAITINKDGTAEYKETADEEPLRFRLTEKETEEIFGLAEKLERFKRPLESNLKVAKTGVKTFRYEHGAEKNEVQFNYSLDPSAKALWDWFERITETERHRIELERTARFYKIGVNDALLQLEVSRDRARLVGQEQFLPILERIIKNESYMHMARERAARLADSFRNTGAPGQ